MKKFLISTIFAICFISLYNELLNQFAFEYNQKSYFENKKTCLENQSSNNYNPHKQQQISEQNEYAIIQIINNNRRIIDQYNHPSIITNHPNESCKVQNHLAIINQTIVTSSKSIIRQKSDLSPPDLLTFQMNNKIQNI